MAIVLGVVAGLIGFLPLVIALRATRKVTRTSNFGHMSILLLGLVASMALLVGFAFACIAIDKSLGIPFVLSEAVTLSVFAIVFGIIRNRDMQDAIDSKPADEEGHEK